MFLFFSTRFGVDRCPYDNCLVTLYGVYKATPYLGIKGDLNFATEITSMNNVEWWIRLNKVDLFIFNLFPQNYSLLYKPILSLISLEP